MAGASGNILTIAETIAAWDCTSLLTTTHTNYCADVTLTPWGPCDGTCMFNDQAAMPELYLPCFTAAVDMSSIVHNNRTFLLSFDIMVVWLPNSNVPNDSPASQIQVNYMVATRSQSSWIPLLSKNAASGSFSPFSWRAIIPSDQNAGVVKISLDHTPAGNGSYGVYVDKIVLSAPSSTPSVSTTPIVPSFTSNLPPLSGQVSISGSSPPTSTNGSHSITSLMTLAPLSQQSGGSIALSTASASGYSEYGTGVATASTEHPFGPNRAMLIGLIVGLLGLLLVAAACAYMWVKRRRQSMNKSNSSLLLSSMAPPYARSAYPILADRKNALPLDGKQGQILTTPIHEGISPAYDLDRPPAYDTGETIPEGASPSPHQKS